MSGANAIMVTDKTGNSMVMQLDEIEWDSVMDAEKETEKNY